MVGGQMSRVKLTEGDGSEVSRVWATAPGLGDSLQPLLKSMYDSNKLELAPRTREAARMRVAHHNGCAVCLRHRVPEYAAAGIGEELYLNVLDPFHPEYSAQESLAIRYADLFTSSHKAIDDAFFVELHEEFTDSEIVELTLLLGIWMGLGRMVRTLDLDHACSLEPSADA